MIKFFPDTKIFIEIGPLQIAWYAIFILIGSYLVYYISDKNLRKVGYKEEDIENLFFGTLITGFLGARIWYVLFSDFGAYLQNPLKMFAVWEGGLAIQGGLIAGVIFGYIYAKRKNLNFWQMSDLIVPNLLLAQAVGRWGNFMNQEAYGEAVSESFYRFFPNWFKNMMFINGEFHHATFFYESVGNVIGWVLIVLVLKRLSRVKRGDLTFAYMMWYGMVRFFVEGLRTDSLMFMGLRMAQVISIIFVVVGVLGYLGVFRRFMNVHNKPIILFDFDGTLMDTEKCIKETFVQVFKENQPETELSDAQLQSFIGPTLYDSFGRYFPEEQVEKLVERYREINYDLHEEHVFPIPHALEVLDKLLADGYRMGIVSSKMASSIKWPMDEFNMHHYFEVVLGYGDFEFYKPHPSGIDTALEMMGVGRDQLIYVGDQPTDIEAGARAGAFTIAYNYERFEKDDSLAYRPNRSINDLREILNILEEDHEWTRTMM